ncbi:MAG: Flp pilus assembly protein CpaB [Rhizobiales bacterium]|nr:Flp pilus assembly protein CpaB [Hyphomicrobiales bacterium]
MKAARLVVLSIAIAAGGVAALLAGRSEKPPEVKPEPVVKVETVDVLVARSDIPMGQTLSPGDVQWQEWPASASSGNFIRKNNRPKAIEDLAGMIARVPFVAGEPIREAKLVNAKGSGFMAAILPTGMRAVSTQISPETGAGGFILPNDRVDVILTRRDKDADKSGGGDSRTSETVLSNIRILAIDQNVEEKNGQKVVVGKTATLELTPGQAETLVLSQQLGALSLALRSVTDASNKDAPEEDNSGKRNTVNIVRFGVSTTTTPR